MRTLAAFLLLFGAQLVIALPPASEAATEDLAGIIEGFVSKQFPDAAGHFWVMNGVPQRNRDEVVLDVNTIVTMSAGQPPAEDRFLLLIVSGKLAAAQHIPLDGETICQTET